MSDRQPDYAGCSVASDAERPGNLKVTFFRNTIHPNDYAEYVHIVFVLVFNSFFALCAARVTKIGRIGQHYFTETRTMK